MKKFFRSSVILMIALLMATLPFAIAEDASQVTDDGLRYVQCEDNGWHWIAIKGYEGTAEEVVIPSEIGGLPVTQICENAFLNSTAITSVEIPTSIEAIGEKAFGGCTGLQSVTIWGQWVDIADNAFDGCTPAEDPEYTYAFGITAYWDSSAHTYCESNQIPFGQIPFWSDNIAYLVNEETGDTLDLYKYTGEGGDVVIPCEVDGREVTTIRINAFKNQTEVRSVYMPDTITTMEEDSHFAGCTGLESIRLSSSLTEIPHYSFEGCSRLNNVSIPEGVSFIGYNAFAGCGTESGKAHFYIYIPDSVGTLGFGRVESSTGENGEEFYTVSDFFGLDLAEGDEYAAMCDFFSGAQAPYVLLNEGSRIEAYLAWYAGKLDAYNAENADAPLPAIEYATQASVSDNFTYRLENDAAIITGYEGEYPDACLQFPNEVTDENGNSFPVVSIESEAFKNRGDFSEVRFNVPSLGEIRENAFEGCYNLKTVYFDEGIERICTRAFADCSGLNSVFFNSGCNDLHDSIFDGCNNENNDLHAYAPCNSNAMHYMLERSFWTGYYEDGHRVQFIGDNQAAYECYNGSEKYISIPNNIGGYEITELADHAFDGSSMRGIALPDSLRRIGDYAFANCGHASDLDIYIPGSVEDFSDNIFENCNLDRLSICIDHYSRIEEYLNEYNDHAFNNNEPEFHYYYNTRTDEEGMFAYAPVSNVTAILHGIHYDYNGEIPAVLNLPSEIDGYEIVEIWHGAFSGLEGVTEINIPDTVRHINNHAFAECTDLVSVSLPSDLWDLPSDVFCGCESLQSIDIPDSVESIGSGAFMRCYNLESVNIGSGVKNIDFAAFMDCTSLKSIVIPDNVEYVGEAVFFNCTALEDVSLSANMWEINNQMFADCTSLREIFIPENISRIGDNAFAGCTSLEEVYLPWNLTDIATHYNEDEDYDCHAFAGCDMDILTFFVPYETDAQWWCEENEFDYETLVLNENGWLYSPLDNESVTLMGYDDELSGDVVLPSMLGGRKVRNIATYAFSGCSEVISFTIPSTVETIGQTFVDNEKLERVYMADSVREIADYCFADNPALREVKLSWSLEYIPEGAFQNCESLESINIEGNCREISFNAFNNCNSLREVYLGEGLEYISDWAFSDCTSLEEIIIPDSVNRIDNGAFADCHSLSYVHLGAGIVDLPPEVFSNCYALSDINFEEGLRFIGDRAFLNCFSQVETEHMIMLDMPVSLENIAGNAFEGCTHLLLKVQYGSNAEKWAHEFFASYILAEDGEESGFTYTLLTEKEGNYLEITGFNDENLELGENGELYIPDVLTIDGVDYTVDGIGAYAFDGHDDITSVSLPESARYISVRGFEGCPNLESVELRGESQMIALLQGAFDGCEKLAEINLPDSVVAIHEACFAGTALTEFTAPANLVNLAPNAFGYSALKTVDLSPAAELYMIDMHAFGSCEELESIILPENLEVIQRNAFAGCYALRSIDLPESLCFIGTKAFYLSGLESIVIPENATNIGPMAFYACKQLKSATLPSGLRALPGNLFDSCEVLESIVIPEGVTSIGPAAFYDCYALSSVTIPDTVTTIEDQAFGNCTSLASLAVPSSVTYIADSAFRLYEFVETTDDETGEIIEVQEDRGLMETITLIVEENSYAHDYAKRIGLKFDLADDTAFTPVGDFAYEEMPEIDEEGNIVTDENDETVYSGTMAITGYNGDGTRVIVPAFIDGMPVSTIAGNAFKDNAFITYVELPDGINLIGENAFANCTALESIVIPDSVTIIADTAFDGCENLTITANAGSRAHMYCMEKGLSCDRLPTSADHFEFYIDDYGLTSIITSYTGNASHVVVPDTLAGFPVVGIDECAFADYDEHGNVIPNGVLQSVVIPEGVEFLASWVFDSCYALTEVVLPDSLREIHYGAFGYCTSLEEIDLPGGLGYLGGEAFVGCESLREIYIPGNVQQIEYATFAGCISLTTVELGADEMYNIADEAFYGCESLVNIGKCDDDGNYNGNILPYGIDSIGNSAFEYCESLTSIVIPETINHIGENAFAFDRKLETVEIPDPLHAEDGTLIAGLRAIENRTFLECNSLEAINIPETVEYIGRHAFAVCNGLTKVEIPGGLILDAEGNPTFDEEEGYLLRWGVTEIGDGAFTCTGLTEVEIPDSVTELGAFVFEGCEELVSVKLPRMIDSIRDSMFFGCYALKNIEIPDGVRAIDSHAFSYNHSLENITIPGSVDYIERQAFYQCENLTNVTFEQGGEMWYDEEHDEWFGRRHINEHAFLETGITSLVLPEGFVHIGEAAFFGCHDLTYIDLPASLEHIDESAFAFFDHEEYPDRLFVVTRNTPAFWWCEEHVDNFICRGEELEQDGYKLIYTIYNLDEGDTVAAITGYEGTLPADLTIPAFIDVPDPDSNEENATREIPVYSITREAFAGNTDITSLTFESETRIIQIPNEETEDKNDFVDFEARYAVQEIEEGAFENCANLETLNLPWRMQWLGYNVFRNCTSLQHISLPAVEVICEEAFNGCSSLESIEIPEGVCEIEPRAFAGCVNLREASIAGSVWTVGDEAFARTGLERLYTTGHTVDLREGIFNDVNYENLTVFVDYESNFEGYCNEHGINYEYNCFEIDNVLYITNVVFTDDEGNRDINAVVAGLANNVEDIVIDGVLFDDDEDPDNDMPVITILDGAFEEPEYNEDEEDVHRIKSVVIGEGVNSINGCAFANCAALESVVLPSTIEHIGESAFDSCFSLSKVGLVDENGDFLPGNVLPGGLTDIWGWTFYNTAISEITMPDSVTYIHEGAFNSCMNLLSVTMPANLRDMDGVVFGHCHALETVTLNEGLEYISYWAFDSCYNLANVNIPASLRELHEGAFAYCYSLTTLDFGKEARGVMLDENGNEVLDEDGNPFYNCFTWIAHNAFEGCDDLIIYVDYGTYEEHWASEHFWGQYILHDNGDDGNFTYALVSDGQDGLRAEVTAYIGDGANAVVPATVVIDGEAYPVCGIGGYAFRGNETVESVTLPASILYIGPSAFRGCTSLNDVEFLMYDNGTPDDSSDDYCDLFAISQNAFSGCSSLQQINLPETLQQIAPGAFEYSGLTSWVQPVHCPDINVAMFDGCVNLESVTLHPGVSRISDYAFTGCSSLKEILLPCEIELDENGNEVLDEEGNPHWMGVSEIGSFAFCGSGLESTHITGLVHYIGDHAFADCHDLVSINMADASIGEINDGTFQYCTSLSEISLNENVYHIGIDAFKGCSSLKTIDLPEEMDAIAAGAFANSGLTEFTVPYGVRSLDHTFENCSDLRTLTVPRDVTSFYGALDGCDLNNMTIRVYASSYMYQIACGLCAEYPGLIMDTIDFDQFADASRFSIDDNGCINGFDATGLEGEEISLIIPDWIGDICVTAIGNYAFANPEYNLVSVTLPINLTTIGEGAFENAHNLHTVRVPNSLEVIESGAFKNCSSLIELDLPENVYSIAHDAFEGAGSEHGGLTLNVVSGSEAYVYAQNCDYVHMNIKPNSPETFFYYIDEGEVHINGYRSGRACDLLLPDTIEGYPVRYIDDYAFADTDIYAIAMPDSIVHIGEGAFANCRYLANVRLPENEEFHTLNRRLFYECESLQDIYIPWNVRGIESEAFRHCSNLGWVGFDPNSNLEYMSNDVFWECYSLHDIGLTDDEGNIIEGNILPEIDSIGNGLFEECHSLEAITLPESLGYIGRRAFGDCHSLRSITLPANVDTIDDWAFQNCGSLSEVSFVVDVDEEDNLNGVRYIRECVFENCHSLNEITLPETLCELGSSAFQNCGSLNTVTFDCTELEYIPANCFNNCGSLQQIVIPVGVTEINDHAFLNCHSLNSVTLPAPDGDYPGVVQIGDWAFENCGNLRSVNFEEATGLERIFSGAFANCGSLRYISFPESLKVIGDSAFENCHRLKSVTFPSSMEFIGSHAFNECHDLSGTIYLPDGLECIEDHTFNNCHDLTGLVCGADLREISHNAFQNTSLKTIEFNDGLEVIRGGAFGDCYNLSGKRIFFPASMNHVEDGAFYGSAEGIIWLVEKNSVAEYMAQDMGYAYEYVGGTVEESIFTYIKLRDNELSKDPFIVITGTTEEPVGAIEIPSEIDGLPVWIIDYDAFSGSARLTSVTLPEDLLVIENGAFNNCLNLESINLPDSLIRIGDGAFDHCESLDGIDLPAGLEILGHSAFQGNHSLSSISIPKDLGFFGDSVFQNCSNLRSVTLPDGLEVLGNYAFVNSGVKSIYIPASLNLALNENAWDNYDEGNEGTGFCAFGRATELESITFADGVSAISDWMFEDCYALESVTIPASVKRIGLGAFENCTALKTVTLSEGLIYIGDIAFQNCYDLTTVNLPSTLKHLGNAAFAFDESLTSISIPAGLEFFGNGAFNRCSSMQSVTLPEGLTVLGNYAFICNDALKEVTLPSTLNLVISADPNASEPAEGPGIGFCAFGLCTGLEKVTITDGVPVIPDWIFEDCYKLSSVSIPNSVTGIGYGAFENCHSLEQLCLPDEINFISDMAFDGCNVELQANFASNTMAYLEENNIDFTIILPEYEQIAWSEINCFNFDEAEHKVELVNVPEGITVDYTDENGEATNVASATGEYIASAKLFYGETELRHYPIADQPWSIVEAISMDPVEDKIYDGTGDITVNYTLSDSITGSEVSLTYYQVAENADPALLESAPVNTGSYIVRASVALPDSDYVAFAEQSYAILPKPANVAANDAIATYDGKAHGADEGFSSEDLLEGHTITAEIAEEQQINVVADYVITPANVKITDADGNDVTANYTITPVPGKLTINALAIAISAEDVSAEYDGNAIQVGDVTVATLAEGDILKSIDKTGSQTDAGTTTVTLKNAVIENAAGADVTTNYAISYDDVVLTVTARKINVATVAETVTYNGAAQLPAELEADKLVEGHVISAFDFVENGAINVSSYDFTPANVKIADADGNDVTANYTITPVSGKLTINALAIAISAEDVSAEYDGNAIQVGDVTVATLAEGDILKSIDKTGSQTDAGTTTVTLKNAVIENAAGADVTANYAISYDDVVLTVTARKINVTTVAETVTYNGAAQWPAVVKTNRLAEGHSLSYRSFAEEGAVNVGEYTFTPNSVKFKDADGNDVTANYDISYVSGKLTIDQREITVAANDVTFYHDGQKHTADSFTATNLVAGHAVSEATVAEAAQADKGVYTITPNAVKIADADGNDVTANYSVTQWIPGKMTITDARPQAIKLSANSVFAAAGEEFQLAAAVLPEGAAYDKLVFSSNSSSITVDSEGWIKVGAAGDAIITATVTCMDGEVVTAECVIRADNLLTTIVPRAMSTINEEAFDGSSIEAINLSQNEGIEIGANAFRNCADLQKVVLPYGAYMDGNVFEGSSDVVLYCVSMEQIEFAVDNEINYVIVDTWVPAT